MNIGSWVAAAVVVLGAVAGAAEPPTDEKAVHAVIERYFRGHATGDAAHFREDFLPTAHVEGIREGKVRSLTREEYCALFEGKPAADEARRVRTVDFVDVTGDAAVAKATLNYGAVVIDYFLLLKIDGKWKIANKVYGRKP
jgi:hypothetical protein